MTLSRIPRRVVFLFFITSGLSQAIPYYGAPIGSFLTISNNVKGEVFAVDANTIFIKDFSYDGASEDAVFWAGSSEYPDISGFIIPNDISKLMPISPYFNHNIILHLPEGKSVKNIRWLSVWNRNSSKSLGTLIFSKPILPPHPMAIGPLVNTKGGVSTGDILILDTQTFLIPDFNYDGSGKETHWWLSKGTKPNEAGIALLENGSDAPLPESKNETIIITLPKGHFVGDYDTLSIWSSIDGDNYGFVDVPKNLNIPPSPHILATQEPELEEFNCEMLNDNLGLEVRWFIKGYDVIIHLVGDIGPSEYMALGLSKDDTETKFDSADAVVAGVDANGKGYAIDYFFESNEKCEHGRGMCPDSIHGSVDNLELLRAERRENFTEVIFKRRLRAEDKVYDQNIYTDGPQAILWAVGPLLPDGFAATPTLQSRGNLLLDFGREPNWNCPPPRKIILPTVYSREKTQHIHCPGDHSFRAQLGSSPRSNVKKVWFINGVPTPELTVQRGNTYTFIVEGGLNPPYHHPFYITNNKEGGLYKNILEANDAIEITYAGIQQDHLTGTIFPIAEGRLCDWTYSDRDPEYSVVTSNQDVKPTLVLKCEPGQPGKLIWTPTADTPDEVYYQSFTERNLGGKIHVVDFCEETNPHRYLEITAKGGKPNTDSSQMDELERESEVNEFSLVSNIKSKENLKVEEIKEKHPAEKENLNKSIAPERIHENYPPKIDKYTISSNVINSFKLNSDNMNERVNDAEGKQLPENTTPVVQMRETEELFPHDESERSDVYVPHHGDLRTTINHNKAAVNSHSNTENLSIKYPTHSASELSSISAFGKQPVQEFKPHFEGGFVPLVMNPMKEKEFAQTKEFIYPPQPRGRPHRPFLYNESVPFHGTFKPGVPDFSGFNISNYSQEDVSIIVAPNQENLSILSSKPQPVHKPFPPFGAIPLHLLQRHNDPSRNQRPQDFGFRFQQQPSLVGTRNNVFPHIRLNKPNFPIPNVREEDLTGVSSQRVYVSMQTATDKKANLAAIPNLAASTTYNRKQQNPPPNKMIYPPPIQRRPDFYEEKEANSHHPNTPQRKPNMPRISVNINNKHSQQNLNLPVLQSGGLQGQVKIRPPMPNPNVPIKNLQGNTEQAMITPGQLRHPYPVMQVPPRERIPQVPLFPKGMQMRPNLPIDEKLKMIDGYVNRPQNPGNRMPFPFHVINRNEKVSQETKESQIKDLSASKEQRHLPHLVNAELVEVPSKTVPQTFTKEKPTINPRLIMQKLHLNSSMNAFVLNSNMRNLQTVPSMVLQKNMPFGTTSSFSILPNESVKHVNISENAEIASSQVKNHPGMSNTRELFDNKSENERSQITKEEKDLEIKYDESYKTSDSHPFNFHQDELEKSFETSASADISSSKPLPTFLDYDSEVDSDISDSVIKDADYSIFNVPFGARLKFPQNGSKIPIKTLNETPKRPFEIIRKSQIHLPNTRDKNSNNFAKVSDSTTTSTTTSTTVKTTATSSTTEATLVAMESISNFAFDNKQNTSSEKGDYIKNLYYTPPLSPLPEISYVTNSSTNSNQDTGSSSEVKHVSITVDTLDSAVERNYPGRKNNLPNNSNSSIPLFVAPPKVSEDINLPQISENLPTHDNRTDYSILNHVLTLIGGPPESKHFETSS